MHEFTAAHRTLPFNAVVRVTNLRNGKQTEVRINDRGPFVANRIIDLSLSAAQAIEMVGTGHGAGAAGNAGGPNPQVGFFGVQVGAFQSQDNAERFRAQLAARYLECERRAVRFAERTFLSRARGPVAEPRMPRSSSPGSCARTSS